MPVTKVDGNNNKHRVFLYTLSTCGWCKKTKEFLKEKGIAYEFIDVDTLKAEERKKAIEDLHNKKVQFGFPVIIIDENEPITGYQPDKIVAELGL